MEKTLFVSDLDGTLMQPDAKLSPETVVMLNDAIADGALFTVATARTPATVGPILKDVSMRIPAIVMTGAVIWDPATNQYSHAKYMNPQSVERLIEIYHRTECPIFLFTLVGNLINIYHIGGPLNEIERQFMTERLHSPHKKFHISPDGREMLPDDLTKTIIFYGMQPNCVAERAYLETLDVPDCRPQLYHDIYGPEIGILDDFNPLATKAEAIREMKRLCGADRVVAFGDNLHDIPMLKAADIAVAVENALPEVKAVADIVIGPNTDNSVARFISEFPR